MDLSLAQQVLAAAVACAEEIGVRLSFSVADEKAMAAPPQVDFGASAPAARP